MLFSIWHSGRRDVVIYSFRYCCYCCYYWYIGWPLYWVHLICWLVTLLMTVTLLWLWPLLTTRRVPVLTRGACSLIRLTIVPVIRWQKATLANPQLLENNIMTTTRRWWVTSDDICCWHCDNSDGIVDVYRAVFLLLTTKSWRAVLLLLWKSTDIDVTGDDVTFYSDGDVRHSSPSVCCWRCDVTVVWDRWHYWRLAIIRWRDGRLLVKSVTTRHYSIVLLFGSIQWYCAVAW